MEDEGGAASVDKQRNSLREERAAPVEDEGDVQGAASVDKQ